jgi:hypothetical protein
LTALTPECPALRQAQMRLMQWNIAPGTYTPGMHQPMLFQYKGLFPFEKVETVLARLFHQFSLFGNRKSCYRRERVNVQTKQYFVFDNIANS